MLLYKYCGPAGVAILRDRSIWFTDPRQFDDPFEGSAPGSVVLSLSARRDSLPMWQHHAAGHTGLVIGFDAFQGILTGGPPMNYVLGPVTYATTRPGEADAAGSQALLARSDEWEHEDEWRLIGSNTSAETGEPGGDAGARLPLTIRPESVQEVILGCRSELPLELDVRSLLDSPHFSHVRLYRARPDGTEYRLNVVEVPRSHG
jgi:hypothetical protein